MADYPHGRSRSNCARANRRPEEPPCWAPLSHTPFSGSRLLECLLMRLPLRPPLLRVACRDRHATSVVGARGAVVLRGAGRVGDRGAAARREGDELRGLGLGGIKTQNAKRAMKKVFSDGSLQRL